MSDRLGPRIRQVLRSSLSVLAILFLATGCPHGTGRVTVADRPPKDAATVTTGEVLLALRLEDGQLTIAHGPKEWKLPAKPKTSAFDGLIQDLNGMERGGVSIAADRAVLYGVVIALLDALRLAGFHRITFVDSP